MKKQIRVRTKTERHVYPPITSQTKDGLKKTFSVVVTTPAKPEIGYVQMTHTLDSVHEGLAKIQSLMLKTLKRDMNEIDAFKKQESLHSLDFYWWALGSYTATQSSVLNLIAYMKGLTLLCMELEKKVADGVPVNVQVEVPKNIERELGSWFEERERAKKAQSEYVR